MSASGNDDLYATNAKVFALYSGQSNSLFIVIISVFYFKLTRKRYSCAFGRSSRHQVNGGVFEKGGNFVSEFLERRLHFCGRMNDSEVVIDIVNLGPIINYA